MSAQTMKSLGDLVEAMAVEVTRKQSAEAEKVSAGVEFLTSLVEALKPVLPAMSSRVPRRANGWLREYDQDGSHVKYFDGTDTMQKGIRGVLLVGELRPTVNTDPSIEFQRLWHQSLWLRGTGEFFSVQMNGEYSRRSDTFWWQSMTEDFSAHRVVREKWPLDEIAASLVETLEATAKGTKKSVPKIDDQARKLRACCAILSRKDLRADLVEAMIKLGGG